MKFWGESAPCAVRARIQAFSPRRMKMRFFHLFPLQESLLCRKVAAELYSSAVARNLAARGGFYNMKSDMENDENTLAHYLEKVSDRETFIEFVWALIRDREETIVRENQAPESHRGYGAFGWQNDTIESYLAAALACVEAHANRDDILKEPSWKAFAEFLYVGKIYE